MGLPDKAVIAASRLRVARTHLRHRPASRAGCIRVSRTVAEQICRDLAQRHTDVLAKAAVGAEFYEDVLTAADATLTRLHLDGGPTAARNGIAAACRHRGVFEADSRPLTDNGCNRTTDHHADYDQHMADIGDLNADFLSPRRSRLPPATAVESDHLFAAAAHRARCG